MEIFIQEAVGKFIPSLLVAGKHVLMLLLNSVTVLQSMAWVLE